MSDEKHLYLVDGHALAYRAYYAMIKNPLMNSKGQPTSAVFGFANYLLRLLQDYKSPYLAVVFDSSKPSFRKEIYEEYKANRSAMPDDMVSQMPLLYKLTEVMNIATFVKDGFEADDIIAHVTTEAEKQGYMVSLVTRDKDLMQLVSKKTRMLAPESGGKFIQMGPDEVVEKMGVPPEKVRDLLALSGDSSDNVPGVPGIGPKTAVKILASAGSVDRLLADPTLAGNPKLAAKIEENRDKLELSRKLVTLELDTGVDFDVEACKVGGVKRRDCADFFTELEFGSLLNNPLFDVREETRFSVTVPASLDDIRRIVDRAVETGVVSIDTETTGTQPRSASLVGVSLAVDTEEAWYIPVGHVESEANLPIEDVLAILKPMIESAEVKKVGQNLKYDYQIFKNHGLVLQGIAFDTMIAAYLIDPGKRGLGMDALASEWLGIKTVSIETLIGKGSKQRSFAQVPVSKAATYAGEDAVIPLRLRKKLEPLLDERELMGLFCQVEMPLITVLAEMEWTGICVDSELLGKLSGEYAAVLEDISREIFALAGEEFNLNSPKQISEVFFNKLGIPKSKKTKTGLSTNVQTLEKLAPEYPIAQHLLEYREVQKLLSTYVDALPLQISPKSGRIHTSLNQTVTTTGRLSSTEPNLQNIPVRKDQGRRIREAFVAPAGRWFVSADYSQIELRVLAHLSGDERLIEAFVQDKDIHTQTAAAVHGIFPEMVSPEMRRAAKTINFGLIYGMGHVNLSRQLHVSFKEAQAFIETYFQQFPGIRGFMEECKEKARTLGYSETLFGRRRYLPDITADNRRVREAAERTAINTPVQGTAADIIKVAMINIYDELAGEFPRARMLLQVHDELVFEVAQEQADAFGEWVSDKMSSAHELAVPLKVDVGAGPNWSAAH